MDTQIDSREMMPKFNSNRSRWLSPLVGIIDTNACLIANENLVPTT